MRFRLKTVFLVTALLALAAGMVARFNRRLEAIPKPIEKSFGNWKSPWTTRPMAAGEYWIILDYARAETGRLRERLRFTLVDATTQAAVPTDSWRVGAKQLATDREGDVVGEFHAVGGHCYAIDVDGTQVKKLAAYGHPRLKIVLTAAEITNRIGW